MKRAAGLRPWRSARGRCGAQAGLDSGKGVVSPARTKGGSGF